MPAARFSFSLVAQPACSPPSSQGVCAAFLASIASSSLPCALDFCDSNAASPSGRALLRSLPTQLMQGAAWVESEDDREEPRRKRVCLRVPLSVSAGLPPPLPRLAVLPPPDAAAVLHALRLRVRRNAASAAPTALLTPLSVFPIFSGLPPASLRRRYELLQHSQRGSLSGVAFAVRPVQPPPSRPSSPECICNPSGC